RELYPSRYGHTSDADAAMRAALETLGGCIPGQQPDPRKVGNKLRGVRKRPRRGMYLDSKDEENTREGALWRLVSTGDPQPVRVCESRESYSTPSYEGIRGGAAG